MVRTPRLPAGPIRVSPARVAQQLKRAAASVASTVSRGWQPRVAAPATPKTQTVSAVQRPKVAWAGGVQHNGNNPEVVDSIGRSYSSRAFAPAGVPFTNGPQQVFSSNKNMTGKPASTSLVLSNPGTEPLVLKVKLTVDEPASARASRTREVVVPPKGTTALLVASDVRDRGFTAFRASVEPANAVASKGRLHVEVATHEKPQTAAALSALPLMKTEGERGYRVPPGRLGDHPAYLQEVRFVMKAAGVKPDPVADKAHWTAARVRGWVVEQQARGRAGQPTAFDPAVTRGLQGRVNGLVAATEGTFQAAPFVASATGAHQSVRLITNQTPPEFASIGGTPARRPGSSPRDAGAYGKGLRAGLPITNPGTTPITVTLSMRAPPVGQDGAQLPGHQVYNGPVEISAPGARVSGAATSARVDQPAAGSDAHRVASLATIVVPPGKTVDVNVKLLVHANSQFPADLVLTRTK